MAVNRNLCPWIVPSSGKRIHHSRAGSLRLFQMIAAVMGAVF
jgi:hypothetical protein